MPPEEAPRTCCDEATVRCLEDAARFSLEPALSLGRGAFVPADGLPIFGSIGDSLPRYLGTPPHATRRTARFVLMRELRMTQALTAARNEEAAR